jgi:hypothetical protein
MITRPLPVAWRLTLTRLPYAPYAEMQGRKARAAVMERSSAQARRPVPLQHPAQGYRTPPQPHATGPKE